jgi:PAS domain-containing protein
VGDAGDAGGGAEAQGDGVLDRVEAGEVGGVAGDVAEGAEEVVEEAVFTPQGPRVFLSTKTPWRDSTGQVIGLVGISRDITERKRAEDAVRRLRSIDRTLTPPEFGKNGKLGKPEKARNDELLALSRRKDPIVEKVLKEVAGIVEKQRAGLAGLKGASDAFGDPELASVAKSLDPMLAERLQVGEEFRDQWKKFGEQVTEFNALLERFNASGDRGAQAELDGWKYRFDPEAALLECSTKLGKSQTAALSRLAEVAL